LLYESSISTMILKIENIVKVVVSLAFDVAIYYSSFT
jgi:hypothetical protein